MPVTPVYGIFAMYSKDLTLEFTHAWEISILKTLWKHDKSQFFSVSHRANYVWWCNLQGRKFPHESLLSPKTSVLKIMSILDKWVFPKIGTQRKSKMIGSPVKHGRFCMINWDSPCWETPTCIGVWYIVFVGLVLDLSWFHRFLRTYPLVN